MNIPINARASRMHLRRGLLCVMASVAAAVIPAAASATDASTREWRFKVTLDDGLIGTHLISACIDNGIP